MSMMYLQIKLLIRLLMFHSPPKDKNEGKIYFGVQSSFFFFFFFPTLKKTTHTHTQKQKNSAIIC